MQITIRGYESRDLPLMVAIWNEVVEDGIAFPQEELLTEESGREFFAGQSWCGVAEDEAGKVLGLYILHPNNVGRCGHICNASYAVSKKARGLHIGEKLVLDCLKEGKLNNAGFVAKAPERVIAEERQKLENAKALLEKQKARLAELQK